MNNNKITIILISVLLISCGKDNMPTPDDNNNNSNPSLSFKDTLSGLCNKPSTKCFDKFNDYYVLINSRVQPLNMTGYQMQFDYDYNDIFWYRGYLNERIRIEKDVTDCNKLKIRELNSGSFLREVKIKKMNDSIIIANDPVLCPNEDCYFIHKKILNKYIASNCNNQNCNDCLNGLCICPEYSTGNGCSNKFFYQEKFSRHICVSATEMESNTYLIFDSHKTETRFNRIVLVDDQLKTKWEYVFNQNEIFSSKNLSLERLSENKALLFDLFSTGNGLKYRVININANQVSESKTLTIPNININGVGTRLYSHNNEYFLHILTSSSNIHHLLRLSINNDNINLISFRSFNTNYLYFDNGKILTFDIEETDNESVYDFIRVREYNSNYSLVSNNLKKYFDNPDPFKTSFFDLTTIHNVKKINNRFIFFIGGTINGLFGDGYTSRSLLLITDSNLNKISTHKILSDLDDNLVIPRSYDITASNNKVYIVSSNTNGQNLNIMEFGDNNYHNYISLIQFGNKQFRPKRLFNSSDGNIFIIGDGFNYSESLIGVKYNHKSLYAYNICK
jgi:hypothetical protein